MPAVSDAAISRWQRAKGRKIEQRHDLFDRCLDGLGLTVGTLRMIAPKPQFLKEDSIVNDMNGNSTVA